MEPTFACSASSYFEAHTSSHPNRPQPLNTVKPSKQIIKPIRFTNGWPCSKCGHITEHQDLALGQKQCTICGYIKKTPTYIKNRELKKQYNQKNIAYYNALKKATVQTIAQVIVSVYPKPYVCAEAKACRLVNSDFDFAREHSLYKSKHYFLLNLHAKAQAAAQEASQ